MRGCCVPLLALAALAGPPQLSWEQRLAAGEAAIERRAWAEAESLLGAADREAPGNREAALVWSRLALVYERQDRVAEAEPFFRRALAVREVAPGPEQLDLAAALEHHARVLRKLQRSAEAEPLESRAQALRARHIETLAPEDSEDPERTGWATWAYAGRQAPRQIYRTDAEYSHAARLAALEGQVEFQAEIWPDGRLHWIRLRRSLGLGLDEQALQEVRKWRYRPALGDGRPVPVSVMVAVRFRLP